MNARRVAAVVTLSVSVLVGMLVVELAYRIIDRQPLTRLALATAPARYSAGAKRAHRPDLQYFTGVRSTEGVDPQWYAEQPEPQPQIPLDAQLAARAARYPAHLGTPFFAFNRQYLQDKVCAEHVGPDRLADFFFFAPVDGRPYPAYRHLAHVSPPGWFVTNNFGWRGPDVTVQRSQNVIRIAFVGSSTTVAGYDIPFSHPEFLEPWLNRWAAQHDLGYRFEVINTGRTGIDTRSMAAIVETELVPLDPDLVVFDGGASQLWPGQVLHTPLKRFFPKPAATLRQRTVLERYSAVVRRVLSAWDRFHGGNGDEPAKPLSVVDWPSGVDEMAPDPHSPLLPMDLPQIVRDLDKMRMVLEAQHGELAVASFIWLAFGGLKLDPVRHVDIYRYLNETLWPIPYAHVRRMADFQNRVFERYSKDAGIPFLDVNRGFPTDPDLYGDPIHLLPDGLRLEAWIYLQHLVPIIEQRLSAGRWPRPGRAPAATSPAFDQPARRLVTVEELAAHCS